jgi:hypothetical protein
MRFFLTQDHSKLVVVVDLEEPQRNGHIADLARFGRADRRAQR